jgi:hypothetical protein
MNDKTREINFDLPEPEFLEGKVVAGMRCSKCKGLVHAVLAKYNLSTTRGKDLDILFDLYCASECGWTDAQWRPWSSREPEKI